MRRWAAAGDLIGGLWASFGNENSLKIIIIIASIFFTLHCILGFVIVDPGRLGENNYSKVWTSRNNWGLCNEAHCLSHHSSIRLLTGEIFFFFFPFFLKKLTGELNYNPLKANNSRAREGIFKDVKETDRNSLYLPILIAI